MTLLDREIAIPFDAFAPALDEVEDIDVLADEIDGSVVAVEPARSAAAPAPPPALAAFPGRCVLCMEALPAAADGLVDRLLDGLAEAEHIAPQTYASRGHVHHDPADLPYWAEVDAARGRLATALDIVVCIQRLGSPQRAYVTVDAPAGLSEALSAVAAGLAEVTSTALLTSAGVLTTQPSESPSSSPPRRMPVGWAMRPVSSSCGSATTTRTWSRRGRCAIAGRAAARSTDDLHGGHGRVGRISDAGAPVGRGAQQ